MRSEIEKLIDIDANSTDAYEAEQLLKEVDIHSVTGNLKSFLRELPEALFTDQYYQKVSEHDSCTC